MKAFAAVVAALAASMVPAPPAQAVPNTACELTTPVVPVTRLAQLPPGLEDLVGPIAEIGAPFNSTDAVLDATLPFRRLIRAGHRADGDGDGDGDRDGDRDGAGDRGDDWFLWYEHGGIGYFWQAVVVRVGSDGSVRPLANAGTISNTLCAITDGAFAGRVPPYPAGSWAASGY